MSDLTPSVQSILSSIADEFVLPPGMIWFTPNAVPIPSVGCYRTEFLVIALIQPKEGDDTTLVGSLRVSATVGPKELRHGIINLVQMLADASHGEEVPPVRGIAIGMVPEVGEIPMSELPFSSGWAPQEDHRDA